MITLRHSNYSFEQISALTDAVEEALYWMATTHQDDGVAYYDLELLHKYVVRVRDKMMPNKQVQDRR